MKKLVLILSTLLICSQSFAGVNNITEEDGSPSVYPWKVKFTNGTVTDNGDGTASVAITGGPGGGGGNVNTSDIAEVPYFITRTNVSGDVNNLWDATNNTHIISEDAGQVGSVLAFSVNNKNGFSVANISHDGSGAFKKLNLSEDLAVPDGGTGASTFTSNGVILGNGTSALNVTTADTATNHFLGSTATTPAFRGIISPDIVGGVFGVERGGTGQSTTSTGDLLVGNTTTGWFKFPVGANGTVLSADSSQAQGVKWVAPPVGGGGGEANTASNLGTGNQLFTTKSGVDLPFRTLTSSDNVIMTTNVNDVAIAVPSIPSEDIVGTIGVNKGGTGLIAGTSGGVLGFTSATTLASSTALTQNAVVIGGGAGNTPTSITADTVVTHGLMATAGSPAFRQLLSSDISGTHSLAQGGTGITSGTANALTYFPNAGVMGALTADTTAGHTLFSTATLPNFRQAITSDSIGTMPVARGGTGITTGNSNGVVYMQNAGLMTTTTADTATNHFLASTATAPAFRQFITTDIAAGVLGFAAGGTGQSTNSLGDILVGNTNGWQKFTVGANGTVLSADSSEPLGVKWVAPPGAGGGEVNTASNLGTGNQLFESKSGVDLRFRTLTSSDNVVMTTNANDVAISVPSIPSNDIVGTIGSNNGGTGQTTSTKGDLLVSDGVGWQKLTVGANGTILSADSAQATGVKWATQSVGGGSVTGSGADTQLAYWTSGTNISSNPSFSINYTGTSNTLSISRDAGQRGNLLNISSDVGALMTYVSYDGSIAINTNSPQLQGKLNVSSDSTTTIPIRVRQPASSTVNAQTWETGTGTTQAAISSDGSGQFGGTIAVRPVDGSFGYDGTTQKAFHYGAAGMSQDLVGVIYTSTANVANINRTSNVSFIDPLSGDIGTNVLPANFWTPGKTVRVKSMGKFRTTANPTMNFSLNLGGRTLVTTGAVNMPTTVNTKYWIVDGYLQCRQTGASGRVMAWSTLTRQGSTAVSTDSIGMMSSDAAIINTTNAASIDIVTAWGTANALNVISADITTIEVLR